MEKRKGFYGYKKEVSSEFLRQPYYDGSVVSSNETPLSISVTDLKIQAETNSFILSWKNPKSEFFSFVKIIFSHNADPYLCSIQDSEVLYVGNGEIFTYNIPDDFPVNDYCAFWISAFSGSPIPNKGLEAWQQN